MEKQKQRKTSDSTETFSYKEKRPSMGFTNFLLILLILLFALNLGFGIWPHQRYETKVVMCDAVETYGAQGWRVVAAYSYSVGNAYTGYTVWNECVIERPLSILSRFLGGG